MAREIPVNTRLLIRLALDKPTESERMRAIYDLILKAGHDGYAKGRDEAINHIFTYHPNDEEFDV